MRFPTSLRSLDVSEFVSLDVDVDEGIKERNLEDEERTKAESTIEQPRVVGGSCMIWAGTTATTHAQTVPWHLGAPEILRVTANMDFSGDVLTSLPHGPLKLEVQLN
jgi:hypothetical protein